MTLVLIRRLDILPKRHERGKMKDVPDNFRNARGQVAHLVCSSRGEYDQVTWSLIIDVDWKICGSHLRWQNVHPVGVGR